VAFSSVDETTPSLEPDASPSVLAHLTCPKEALGPALERIAASARSARERRLGERGMEVKIGCLLHANACVPADFQRLRLGVTWFSYRIWRAQRCTAAALVFPWCAVVLSQGWTWLRAIRARSGSP
jgi:hypothetical protein